LKLAFESEKAIEHQQPKTLINSDNEFSAQKDSRIYTAYIISSIIYEFFISTTSLKISGVASQFAMQNSGIAPPEVEVYNSFAIPKSVKSNGI
jgi:hypothetical protein